MTNPERVRKAIKDNAANALLVKVNQIGSLTETIEAVETVSGRAGERSLRIAPAKRKTRPSPILPWR